MRCLLWSRSFQRSSAGIVEFWLNYDHDLLVHDSKSPTNNCKHGNAGTVAQIRPSAPPFAKTSDTQPQKWDVSLAAVVLPTGTDFGSKPARCLVTLPASWNSGLANSTKVKPGCPVKIRLGFLHLHCTVAPMILLLLFLSQLIVETPCRGWSCRNTLQRIWYEGSLGR